MPTHSNSKGFTLLELMIAMMLLSILALLLIGNYVSSIAKGRDSQRKNDLNQMQRALEMYYEDTNHYPPLSDDQLFGKKFCDTSPNVDTCSKIYMIKTPNDPHFAYTYHYETDGTPNPQSYYLYAAIENLQDKGQNVNANGYEGIDVKCGNNVICRYYVSSPNADPPEKNP